MEAAERIPGTDLRCVFPPTLRPSTSDFWFASYPSCFCGCGGCHVDRLTLAMECGAMLDGVAQFGRVDTIWAVN